MKQKAPDLQIHIVGSYHALRLGVAVLGALLPLALVVGGYALGSIPLQGSMSAYYHAGDGVMRDVFVGVLFAVGSLLFVYHGYRSKEDWALNLAGAFVWGVALVPMEWECGTQCASLSLHGALAMGFFLCLAFVCWFCASDTVQLIEEQRESAEESDRAEARKRATRYRRLYKLLSLLLLGSPIAATIFAASLDPTQPRRFFVFAAEAFGVYAFSLYWLVKGREVSETQADRLAVEGLLAVPDARVFQAVPVTLRSLRSE